MHFSLNVLTSSLLFLFLITACAPTEVATPVEVPTNPEQAETALVEHLTAVMGKDMNALVPTLPEADYPMQLILPDGTRMESVAAFLEMHTEWFQDTSWTMEMDILFMDRTGPTATSIVEAMYREADRDGKPYFHKMYITYALKKFDSRWLVVMDHASTVEKTQ